jgi:hypothetical protein
MKKTVVMLGLVGSISFAFGAPAPAEDYASIPMETRIKRAETIARGLQADGHIRDWAGFPARTTPYYPNGDLSKTLVTSRVLADTAGLHVCVTTPGVPSRDSKAFGFKLDLTGPERSDVDFSESAGNECPQVTYPDGSKNKRSIQGVQYALGECIEWFVPWNSLTEALPEIRDSVVGPGVRPWIRIMPYTFDTTKNVITSYGAAAACIRLPYNEEAMNKLPHEADEVTSIGAMIEGQSYVVSGAYEGPDGWGDHREKWCYDLTVMDPKHSPSVFLGGRQNSQYYAYNKKLVAPVDGQVTMVENSLVDHLPWLPMYERNSTKANYVLLSYGEKTLWFVHDRQGSLVPQLHDFVSKGAELARIGDTGPSAYPHVHIQVHRGGNQQDLIPIALKNVRVSLNGGKYPDYWARDFRGDKVWNIQEGFFFENLPGTPSTQ